MNYDTKYHCIPTLYCVKIHCYDWLCLNPSIQFKSVFSSEMSYYPK